MNYYLITHVIQENDSLDDWKPLEESRAHQKFTSKFFSSCSSLSWTYFMSFVSISVTHDDVIKHERC